jgi:hypothetical protein
MWGATHVPILTAACMCSTVGGPTFIGCDHDLSPMSCTGPSLSTGQAHPPEEGQMQKMVSWIAIGGVSIPCRAPARCSWCRKVASGNLTHLSLAGVFKCAKFQVCGFVVFSGIFASCLKCSLISCFLLFSSWHLRDLLCDLLSNTSIQGTHHVQQVYFYGILIFSKIRWEGNFETRTP